MPISQQKLMDMVMANSQAKRLESAYYPIKLKKNFVYDPKVLNKLQKFPGMLHLNWKKRSKQKPKNRSPQNMKTHHNLYVAYIKGNSRRLKPTAKPSCYSSNRPAFETRLNTSLNPGSRVDHIRKSSHGVPDSLHKMLPQKGPNI